MDLPQWYAEAVTYALTLAGNPRSQAADAVCTKHSEDHIGHEDGGCVKDARGPVGN